VTLSKYEKRQQVKEIVQSVEVCNRTEYLVDRIDAVYGD
jgi:hypothetical protein